MIYVRDSRCCDLDSPIKISTMMSFYDLMACDHCVQKMVVTGKARKLGNFTHHSTLP